MSTSAIFRFDLASLLKNLFAAAGGKTVQASVAAKNTVANALIKKPDPMKPPLLTYMHIAISEIGIKEGAGKLDNPAVLKMFADAGHPEIKHDEVPWCAAFIGSVLHRAGLPNSGSLAARSYERYGQKLSGPAFGAIGVKKRLVNGKDVGAGHVFFIVAADATHVHALGGNQSDAVNVARIPRSEVIAYRLPLGIDPKTLPPLPTIFKGSVPAGSEA